ncbi:MAG TPA: LysR family transcriptional regulator [Steroidobacteraceae bacterium]|nr:LysR family transcriptional regulator [Steroidobacteraceae bacterium]
MRYKRFNLNLLAALDALLKEQSATRAAQRVNVSQPAMSTALAQLRDHFQDEILIRVGRSFALTPLGEELSRSVRDLMIQTEAALDTRSSFDPATSGRRFRLQMSDYVATVLFSDLARAAHRLAPGVSFELFPPQPRLHGSVERGETDLVVVPQEFISTNHPSEPLFQDRYICMAWSKGTRFGAQISLKQYLESGHVVATPGGQLERISTLVDQWLYREFGEARHLEIITSEFSSIPPFVVGTDRIATVAEKLAQYFGRLLPLRVWRAPFNAPPLMICTQWNRHREKDHGIRWLRGLLKATVAEWRRPAPATNPRRRAAASA